MHCIQLHAIKVLVISEGAVLLNTTGNCDTVKSLF